eukprot:TRINITY_DN7242_c0_g1_i1.p1 TRINITY_DN7242_c0_g1~~TRINITY_DN7242_c0_g1_i1.p1  ORF type:complete len:995 (-),score=303.02 TRINITY_DN7242_c0_g1_i1:562-3546(-)
MPGSVKAINDASAMNRFLFLAIVGFTLVKCADINGYAHVYLGCYSSGDVAPGFVFGPETQQYQTPFGCIERCESMDYGYAGLMNEADCYCGRKMPDDVPVLSEKMCNSACTGDKNQMCGSNLTTSVYARATMPELASPPSAHGTWTTLVTNDSSASYSTLSPGRRAGHTAIASPRGGMFIFGGYTVWETKLVNISLSAAEAGDDSVNGSLTEDVTIYVYTWTGEVHRSNTVWRFDLATYRWVRTHTGAGVAPTKRSSHSAVVMTSFGLWGGMIIFGGYAGTGEDTHVLDDLWAFDFNTKLWTPWGRVPPGRGPRARAGHSAVAIDDNRMIIFGGATSSEYMNDVWEYSFYKHKWRLISDGTLPGPSPRSGHAAVLSPSNKMVVTFGRGVPSSSMRACGMTTFRDTWELDPASGRWRLLSDASEPWDAVNRRWATTPVPPSRFGHTASMTQNSLVIFGGSRENEQLSDVWAFDFGSNAWRPLEQSKVGPANRSGFSAVPLSDGIIIFGGEVDSQLYFNDVWRWRFREDFQPSIETESAVTGFVVGVVLACFWAAVLLAGAAFYVPARVRELLAARHHSKLDWRFVPSASRDDVELQPMTRTSPNSFDRLPDEVVLEVLCRLEGFEISRMAMTCKRFRDLARDQTCWRAVVQRRWCAETPSSSSSSAGDDEVSMSGMSGMSGMPPDGANFLEFYVLQYKAAQLGRKEAQMFSILAAARTTLPLYIVCMLASAQVYVISLAIDNYIQAPWHLVFAPLWLVDAALVMLASLLAYFLLLRKSTPFEKAVRRWYPFVAEPSARAWLGAASLLWIISGVLVAQKLDGVRPLAAMPWCVALLPVMLLLGLAVAYAVYAMYAARSWVWSALWGGLYALSHLASVVMVAAKLDAVAGFGLDWCNCFMPWWASDVFVLAGVIVVFRSVTQLWLGMVAAFLGCAYVAGLAAFQALTCVELGSSCGNERQSFGFVIASLPLQCIVCLLGVLAILLLRKRSQKLGIYC